MEGSSECLAEADALEDSLSLAVLVLDSEATHNVFLLAPCGTPSLDALPLSSGLPFPSPAPALPLSLGFRVSLGLRAVLKKDKPLSSVLLLL